MRFLANIFLPQAVIAALKYLLLAILFFLVMIYLLDIPSGEDGNLRFLLLYVMPFFFLYFDPKVNLSLCLKWLRLTPIKRRYFLLTHFLVNITKFSTYLVGLAFFTYYFYSKDISYVPFGFLFEYSPTSPYDSFTRSDLEFVTILAYIFGIFSLSMLSLNTTNIDSNNLSAINIPKNKRAIFFAIKMVIFSSTGLIALVYLFEFSPEILKNFYIQLFMLIITVGMTTFALRVQTHQKSLISFVIVIPTSILIASYFMAIADFNPKVELNEKIRNLIELGSLANDDLHAQIISDLEKAEENTVSLKTNSLTNYLEHFPNQKKLILNTKAKLTTLCDENLDYRCRLLAYVEKIELDAEELSYKTMERGCPKDLKSCLYFYGDDKASEQQRALAISELSKRCFGEEDWKDFPSCQVYRDKQKREKKKENKSKPLKTSAHHPNISGQT